jgi:hypothetical protein
MVFCWNGSSGELEVVVILNLIQNHLYGVQSVITGKLDQGLSQTIGFALFTDESSSE